VQQAWGFGDGVYKSFDGMAPETDLKVTAVVDEINTAVVKLEDGEGVKLAGVHNDTDGDGKDDGFALAQSIAEVDEAYLVTNLAAAFGLEGVTLKTMVGLFGAANYDVTSLGSLDMENKALVVDSDVTGVQLEVGYGSMVAVKFLLMPGKGDAMDGMVALKGGFGPVTAEFFYSDYGAQKPDKGEVGFGVKFAQTVVPDTLDLAVIADYEMELDSAATAYQYSAGVEAGLMGGLATVGVGMVGKEKATLQGVEFSVNVAPVAFAGLDFYTALGFDAGATDYNETLQYLEASAYLKPGAATYRLGYAFYNDKATDAKADGGTLTNDYKAGGFIAGAESGFMFLNVSLSF
jgi:hypothetical protein